MTVAGDAENREAGGLAGACAWPRVRRRQGSATGSSGHHPPHAPNNTNNLARYWPAFSLTEAIASEAACQSGI